MGPMGGGGLQGGVSVSVTEDAPCASCMVHGEGVWGGKGGRLHVVGVGAGQGVGGGGAAGERRGVEGG